jgi:hypothetical protein
VVNRDAATPATMEAAKKYAREQNLACAFMLGADRKRYGKLLENLENDYTQKNHRWPKTITDAYSLLIKWKQDPRNLLQVVGTSSDGIAFANIGEKATEKKVTNSTPATATGNEEKKVWVPPPPLHTVKCVVQPKRNCKDPIVVSSREEAPSDIRQRSVEGVYRTQE